MDNNSNEITFSDVIKGALIALTLIILLGTGYITGVIVSPNNSVSVGKEQESFTVQNPENIKEVEIKPVTPGSVTTPTVQSPETTAAPAEDETTSQKAESDKGTADEKTTKPAKAQPVKPAQQEKKQPAVPISRATPLQRPVSVAQEKKPVHSMKPDAAEKPSFTYAELLKQRRKTARRPLSTGNDRY